MKVRHYSHAIYTEEEHARKSRPNIPITISIMYNATKNIWPY